MVSYVHGKHSSKVFGAAERLKQRYLRRQTIGAGKLAGGSNVRCFCWFGMERKTNRASLLDCLVGKYFNNLLSDCFSEFFLAFSIRMNAISLTHLNIISGTEKMTVF